MQKKFDGDASGLITELGKVTDAANIAATALNNVKQASSNMPGSGGSGVYSSGQPGGNSTGGVGVSGGTAAIWVPQNVSSAPNIGTAPQILGPTGQPFQANAPQNVLNIPWANTGVAPSLSIPANQSPAAPQILGPAGQPSWSTEGRPSGTGRMEQAPELGPNFFGGMGIKGAPPTVSVPGNSDYSFLAPPGAAPNQADWGDEEAFGFVRGHFRRFPAARNASFGGSAGSGTGGGVGTGGPGSGGGGGAGGGGFSVGAIDPNDPRVGGGMGAGASIAPMNTAPVPHEDTFGHFIAFRTIRELGHGVSETMNDIAMHEATGQINPMGLGQGIGNLGGAALAASLIGMGVGGPIAGIAGLIAAPIIGAGVNIAMARPTARFETANQFAGYAGATGQDASFLATNAQQVSDNENKNFDIHRRTTSNTLGAFWDETLRRLGKYPGTDQTTTQSVGQIEGFIGGAYLQTGQMLGPEELRQKSQYYINRGTLGVDQSAQGARAISALNYSAGNAIDAALQVGIEPIAQNFISQNRPAAALRTVQAFGRLQQLFGQEEAQAGGVSEAEANIRGSQFIGRSITSRRGYFDTLSSELQDKLTTVNSEIDVIAANVTDPNRSINLRQKRGEAADIRASIAEVPNQYAEAVISQFTAQNAAGLAQSNIDVTIAGLRGTPQDILRAGRGQVAALQTGLGRLREISALPGIQNNPLLLYQNQQAIAAQQAQLAAAPYQAAESALRLTNLSEDVNISTFQADITSASFFGSDSDLAKIGVTQRTGLATISQNALLRSTDQSLTASTRFGERQRSESVRNTMLESFAANIQSQTERVLGRGAASEASTQNVFTRATLSGNLQDISAAGGNIQSAFQGELTGIMALRPQMNVPQLIAADQRQAAIEAQQISAAVQTKQEQIARVTGLTGVTVGQTQNVFQQSVAFGSDASIGQTGASMLAAIASQRAALIGQLPGASIPQQIQLNQQITQSSVQEREAGITVRSEEIARVEGRAGLANQASDNMLNRAMRLGSGNDVRGAAGGLIASLGAESSQIQEQINRGGLTFEQGRQLRSRQLEISRTQFDTGQTAIDTGYQKEDLAGFSIRQSNLATQRQINELLPFGGADRFTTDVLTIRNNQSQLGVLQRRASELSATGNLSPERAFGLTQQANELRAEIAQGESDLSTGMENRLPALSAGRTASFAMFTSQQLASLRYFQIGSPVRDSGAISGRHMAMQDAWFNQLSSGMVPSHLPSRTSEINIGRGGGYHDPFSYGEGNQGASSSMGQGFGNTEILLQILQAIQQGNQPGLSAAQRLSEAGGRAEAMQRQHRVGQGYSGTQH